VSILLVASWIVEGATRGFAAAESSGPAVRISDWLRTGALLWASLESLRYYAKMRRRLRLGIADPVVTNRFLMWGLGIGAAGLTSVVDSTTRLFVLHAMEMPWLRLCISLGGVVAATGLWLAFLPPSRHTRWLRRATPSLDEP